MNARQQAKSKMYDRSLGFYETNKLIFNDFPLLKSEDAEAVADNAQLHTATSAGDAPTTGITDATLALRTAMGAALLPLANTALGWAIKNDKELVPNFSLVHTDFDRGALPLAVIKADHVIKALRDNLGVLGPAVKITAAMIDAAQAKRDLFAAAIKNTSTVQGTNEAATGEAAAWFPKMDEHMAVMDAFIDGQFTGSQPALVAEWHIMREIGATVRRHTGIHLTATDSAHQPLEGVQMKITESGRTAVTDIHGEAELQKMHPGAYHLTYTHGGVVKTAVVEVKSGVTVDVVVMM